MFKKSTAWSDDPRFAHTQHMVEVCPPELLPKLHQNMATGGMYIEWPDVCRCPINGGPTFEVHEVQDDCLLTVDALDNNDLTTPTWGCTCPDGPDGQPALGRWISGGIIKGQPHLPGCPFDNCPLGTCHPMCSQVTHDGQSTYCHCACHG